MEGDSRPGESCSRRQPVLTLGLVALAFAAELRLPAGEAAASWAPALAHAGLATAGEGVVVVVEAGRRWVLSSGSRRAEALRRGRQPTASGSCWWR